MTRKLSVHAGAEPTGLDEFLAIANPSVLYLLNNTVTPPGDTITIKRVQNDVWGRLPDAMNQTDYFLHTDPVASAHYELTQKTIYVPKHGNLNLLDYWRLGQADYYAPYNEPVLGDSVDHILKASWLNDWTCEALRIAGDAGIRLSIFSFASSNPHTETWPYLTEAVETCIEYAGIIDLHAYGIEGGLMSSPSSGATFYRAFHDYFSHCPPIVISEASAGNGYDTGLSGQTWVDDMIAYARKLERDDYVLGACAFQLDQGAESHIDYNALMRYAEDAAALEVDPPPPPPDEMLRFGGIVNSQHRAALIECVEGFGGRVWFGGVVGDEVSA